MNDQQQKTVLIIGGGPSTIGRETELDAVVYHIVNAFQRLNWRSLVIDSNAYSLATSEMNKQDVFYQKVTEKNVINIIKQARPDAILPVLGGFRAVNITKKLLTDGILDKYHVELMGISEHALQLVGNPLRLSQLAHEINEPIVPSEIIHSGDEGFDIIRKMGLPVIVKAVLPEDKTGHKECKDMDSLAQVLNSEMVNSKIGRCVVEKSVVGDKELSMVGMRDSNGTKILINGLEDIDAIGIHSGDSMAISPIQTITETEYQQLRNATFKIMETLDLNGFCDVSFALDKDQDQYFITKVNPYYTRGMALAEIVTGYPLKQVFANLLVQRSLSEVKLDDQFYPLTAIMEPTVDHIMVRMPIWPFQDMKGLSPRLKQSMKSVGSAVGIGRTVEEAMLKALRSSQFNPRDTLPNMKELGDDQLINQLIHPQANRIQVLIEALRRDYQIEDLAELTKIDAFYFTKLKHLLHTEKMVVNEVQLPETVKIAHQGGFGDGMLASTWHLPIEQVQALAESSGSTPTYKMIEPSAGEIIYDLPSFYSSYERENEAQPLSNHSVLVIGRGGNHLGPNTAADYYTTELLLQMKQQGFKTIILNHNPNSATLANSISDRCYIEPIQLGNILDIIRLENPEIVIIPGNRHYLVREIQNDPNRSILVLPPDQETDVELPKQVDFTLNFFVTLDETIYITAVGLNSTDGNLDHVSSLTTRVDIPQNQLTQLIQSAQQQINNHEWKGLVQVMGYHDGDQYYLDGIRPVRIIETIFLNRITSMNWIAKIVELYTNRLNIQKLKHQIDSGVIKHALLKATYPYKKLGLKDYLPSPDYEVGAFIDFDQNK